MKIGIVGYGHVGKHTHKLFKDAIIYDNHLNMGSRNEINLCDTVFICVPTPMSTNGSCDTSIVESVIQWVQTKLIIICSTVAVGFTDLMMKKYSKEIVFHPEYYGETTDHPFANLETRQWLSFGGSPNGINLAIKTFQTVLNSNIKIHQAPAKDIEFAKYMENVFLAAKVTFCNEMYDIANALGVNYYQSREAWLADPRIGRSHTFVYEDNRGFDGKCLPKDLSSLLYQAHSLKTDVTFLEAIQNKNNYYKEEK